MSDLLRAAELLRQGGLVAFPTETVYGLGASATNADAIAKIFLAKGRPSTNPLIVHIADAAIAKQFVTIWPQSAQKLAEAFWPGPLTIVLPKSPAIVDAVTAGRTTVGLRVPDHPIALDLLRAFNGPVAAPSANRSNHISPTTAQHVRDDLGDSVDFVLDGGPCRVGIESTVIDLSGSTPTILRPGGVSQQQIESVIGPVEVQRSAIPETESATSPGQAAIHYAPKATAYRFHPPQLPRVLNWCRENLNGRSAAIVTISNQQISNPQISILQVLNLPPNPTLYAQQLYATLRKLDAQGTQIIFLEMPPSDDAWAAVTDRLTRATKPLP